VDEGDVASCQKLFADFARQTKDAPLYSRLAAAIADDRDLVGLLHHAPTSQRLPVLLFASVHWLLLQGTSDPLVRYYPNLAPQGQPPPQQALITAFRTFCHERQSAIAELLATRRTQTNEIGRTALLLPSLALLERERGPLAQVDVGASAGLNLLIPHYDYTYEPGGVVETGSAVRILCGTRGDVPVPATHPAMPVAIGVDANPVDITDPDQALWLEACVWPDHVDRFERLAAAIAVANDVGVDVRQGDAVDALAAVVTEASASGHPVVTTTWVMNYLPADRRVAFVGELDRIARYLDVSWLYAENPALSPELPGLPPPRSDGKQPTAVVLVRWRGGKRDARRVADAHPHGRWLHWR
jgi:hypothetical protein